MAYRPEQRKPSSGGSQELLLQFEARLIQHATEYMTGVSRFVSPPDNQSCRAAEVIYSVFRISHGDVRLRLSRLAARLHVSPRSVAQCFRELYGSTPKDLQISVRIDWVRNAIGTQPDRKLDSIAAEAGYADIADFNHFFRKHTGMSPSEYRVRSLALLKMQNLTS